MNEFQSFGDPDLLEIGLRWRNDSERRSRRPAGYGWSTGDIRIVVAGRNLTTHTRGAASQAYTGWYLLPIADWLAAHWQVLLHQQEFSWPERSAAPAAIAANRRLDSLIAATDGPSRRDYAETQTWRNAHALRAAASGGLLPDLFLRRYIDHIELSWTSADPLFAPNGLRFMAEPGVAYLPVQDVAAPLWAALHWIVRAGAGRIADEHDAASLGALEARLQSIERATVLDFAAARMGRDVAASARAALDARGVGDAFFVERASDAPAATLFSPAVAMYGGVAPSLTQADAALLADVIVSAAAPAGRSDGLTPLIDDRGGPPLRSPFLEGQDLAIDLLDDRSVAPFVREFVDVEAFLREAGVNVMRRALDTHEVRGIALAGKGLTPTVVINASSVYNDSPQGERFTLAHELAHLLHDRSMAISVGMASGPWTPRGVEQRANAFAAMFLMPRFLVARAFGVGTAFNRIDAVTAAAERLRVSVSALIEHLTNLDFITDSDRETLRRRGTRHDPHP